MSITKNAAFYRIFPFALFMTFIGIEECFRLFVNNGIINFSTSSLYFLYPLKAFSVAFVLFLFLPRFHEINLRDLSRIGANAVSIFTGFIVFILWINMDWRIGTIGNTQGFNPNLLPGSFTQTILAISRIFGAVLVVPVMEELFWRSFLIRYIINQDFEKVPLGKFTWSSFVITTVLFGFEHNFFLAGIMAGIAYNLLFYYTKSLSQCVLAHAVTNLALGLYVLCTGKWYFW